MPYQFRCKDTDHGCRWQATADTREELMALVAAHVKKAHRVEAATETIGSYLRQKFRQI